MDQSLLDLIADFVQQKCEETREQTREQVRKEVREDIAKKLLTIGRHSIAEIAELVHLDIEDVKSLASTEQPKLS